MRKNSLDNKVYFTIGLTLVAISLIYIGAYAFFLKEYSAMHFILRYSFIYFLIARPVFYTALFAVITRIIILRPFLTLPTGYIRFARYLFVILILLYILLMIQFFFVVFPLIPFNIDFYLTFDSPILYILIGIFSSLSISTR